MACLLCLRAISAHKCKRLRKRPLTGSWTRRRLNPSSGLAGRLVRVLGPIIQAPMLSMGNAGHNDGFRGRIASQLVRNNHAWSAPSCSQQLAKESHRRESYDTIRNLFRRFGMGEVLRLFAPVAEWQMQRLPQRAEGYTLDLDSTVLERYGKQEGSLKGHNPRTRTA